MTIGFDTPLYILPFDHRATFQTKMFGWKGTLTPAQTEEITAAKQVIYDGFKAALSAGVPKGKAGILVDEQFGSNILRDAARNGYSIAYTVEKSGQEEFDFEYGDDFARHIEAFNPTFGKVLVRYNPEGDSALNQRQAVRLNRLSDYLHGSGRMLMFELLVPATKAQLDRVHGDQKAYDRELRPSLMVRAIHQLQGSGVEPDVWKIEGLDRREDSEKGFLETSPSVRSAAALDTGDLTVARRSLADDAIQPALGNKLCSGSLRVTLARQPEC